MNILVTGSEGNIGKKLVPYLKARGHVVTRTDNISKVEHGYIQADIWSSDLWYKTAGIDIDVVYHLAAMVSRVTCEVTPDQAIHTNICGTNGVIQLCKLNNAYLINFSTSEVYGNVDDGYLSPDAICLPNNRYGLSKYLAERLVEYEIENYALKAINVRPFMIYDEDEDLGEHRSAMVRFAEALIKKQPIKVHYNSKRGWLHISDAVKILEKLADTQIIGTMNIGSGGVATMRHVAETMCRELGLDPFDYIKDVEQPDRMTLVKIPILTVQDQLGYTPKVTLEDGIRRVLRRVKERLT